jgi:hypothetical protein
MRWLLRTARELHAPRYVLKIGSQYPLAGQPFKE